MDWKTAALLCEERYGAYVDYEEQFFTCPECYESILYDDEWEDLEVCPICGFMW